MAVIDSSSMKRLGKSQKINSEKERIRRNKYRRPLEDIEKKTKINLLVNKYDSETRQHELDYCREKNEANRHIDNCVYIEGRLGFNDFIPYMKKDEINVIANADIYFDETIKLAEHIKESQVYALTRHEEIENQQIISFRFRNGGMLEMHTQDAWIFRGVPPLLSENVIFGIPGCDNKLAWHLNFNYELLNPCYSINAIHVHEDEKRSYNPHNGIEKYRPPYKFVEPC